MTAADLGAGTGIFSRLLAERGVRVLAIEPNDNMRSAATPHTGVHWVSASAEATGLASGSVDLAVAAQAWHWFEPTKTAAEVARILRPGGRLALVWYDDRPGCPASARYRRAVKPGATEAFGSHTSEQWSPTLAPPFDSESNEPPMVFEYDHRLDLEGLIGRALSASYVPLSGPDADRIEYEMTQLHADLADETGFVTLGLICVVHRFALPGSVEQ
ncbi:MAG TPA: class I SAM-dependent methyltransferase [Phycisphaerales bacterium]|nr:class I SAM-dependent methyltransferase [Phycisphaerales bacterium]